MELSIILIIAGVLVVAIILGVVTIYNGLINARNRVDNDFANIDTQLQRRSDLIPNLVNTAKEYARHESAVFAKVSELRAGVESDLDNHTIQGAQKANRKLDMAMANINALAEAYPELRASENFAQLQEELATTENKVSFARQAYNDSVANYNTKQEVFPSNIVSGIFGKFTQAEMFVVEEPEARKAPKVDFS